jgi:hypothetical protein
LKFNILRVWLVESERSLEKSEIATIVFKTWPGKMYSFVARYKKNHWLAGPLPLDDDTPVLYFDTVQKL